MHLGVGEQQPRHKLSKSSIPHVPAKRQEKRLPRQPLGVKLLVPAHQMHSALDGTGVVVPLKLRLQASQDAVMRQGPEAGGGVSLLSHLEKK